MKRDKQRKRECVRGRKRDKKRESGISLLKVKLDQHDIYRESGGERQADRQIKRSMKRH